MESNSPCDRVRPLISAYYDNELSVKEMLEVNNHLESCPHCNNEYECMKKIGDCIRKSSYLPHQEMNTWQQIASRLD